MRTQHPHRRLRRSGRPPGSGGTHCPREETPAPALLGRCTLRTPSRMMEQKVGRAIGRATETDPKTTFLPKTN